MQASLQTGWWREENWVLPILILASATLLLLLLFQVSFKVIITFLLLIQTWNAGSAVGQINQGQGQQQVGLILVLNSICIKMYRVFLYTGPPPKSSKYQKVNLG